MNLILGDAHARQTSTGKTEIIKDIWNNIGLGFIINNCSEQMDIETTKHFFFWFITKIFLRMFWWI